MFPLLICLLVALGKGMTCYEGLGPHSCRMGIGNQPILLYAVFHAAVFSMWAIFFWEAAILRLMELKWPQSLLHLCWSPCESCHIFLNLRAFISYLMNKTTWSSDLQILLGILAAWAKFLLHSGLCLIKFEVFLFRDIT